MFSLLLMSSKIPTYLVSLMPQDNMDGWRPDVVVAVVLDRAVDRPDAMDAEALAFAQAFDDEAEEVAARRQLRSGDGEHDGPPRQVLLREDSTGQLKRKQPTSASRGRERRTTETPGRNSRIPWRSWR